jgi:hypothetical protein
MSSEFRVMSYESGAQTLNYELSTLKIYVSN